jgi:hypothetical protein
MANGIMDYLNQQQMSPMSQMNLAKPQQGQMMAMPQTQVGAPNPQVQNMKPLATPQQMQNAQTPMGQQKMGALGGDFDIKGFASSMTKALSATNDKAQQMQQVQTNPGRPMDMQAYNAQVGGMNPMGSNAMKTIQGFQNQPIGGSMIGGQPNMQQLMQALRG